MGTVPDLSKYERFQDVTQGKMRYYEAGTGRTVLLIHATGAHSSAEHFLFMFELLAAKYHVVAPDLIGFGKSTRALVNGPTFEIIVDSIREFMNSLGIESADFIGQGSGAWFCGLLAYESPHLVRSMTGIGSAGLNEEAVASIANYQPFNRENTKKQIGNSVFEGSQLTWEGVDALVDSRGSHATNPSGEAAFEALKPLVHQMVTPGIRKCYLLQRRLPHIKMPILWMWSTSEHIEPGPTWTAEWESTGGDPSKGSKPWVAPNAQYYLMRLGTHHFDWEYPKETVQVCSEFIDSVPQT